MFNELDELDKILLKELMEDSRKSVRNLAHKLQIPHSTLHDRLRKLRNKGLIKKYTIIIDELKLGYEVKALILINVDGKHILEVEEEIAKHPNVQMVLDITGEFDIAVIVVFKNIRELDKFVKDLLKNPYIRQTRTSIAFRVVKQDLRIPL